MSALENQAVVSKGKEDLQIISSACAVTLLAALRAAFMLPQQREELPRVCNVPFRILQAGSGWDRADTGQKKKFPLQPAHLLYPCLCLEVFVLRIFLCFSRDPWKCQLRGKAGAKGSVWASWLGVRSFCRNQQAVSFTNH